MAHNIGDPEAVKKDEKEKKFVRDNQIADLRAVLDTRHGRRLLWRYISMCDVFKHTEEMSARIYFNEGKKAIGLTMIHDITEANDEAFIKMMREAKEKHGN